MPNRATGREFQRTCLDAAHAAGFRIAQVRAVKTSHGWRTPMQADGVGWPDFTLVGRGRIMFRELKSGSGRLSREQAFWLDWLREHGGDAGVWTDRDLDRIYTELGLRVRGVNA